MGDFHKLRSTIIVLFFLNCSDAIQLKLSSPYAVQGNSLTISCLVEPDVVVVVRFDGTPLASIVGLKPDNECNLTGSYDIQYLYHCNCSMTSCVYNVTIPGDKMNEKFHMKLFTFQAYPPVPDTKEVRFKVHVPITKLHIAPNTTGIAVGSSQSFKCTTDAGRPMANIQWYLSDGTNLTELASLTACNQPCKDKVEAFSVLMYTGKLGDNNKTLFCNASNEVGKSKKSQDVLVEIWYGPSDVVLSPSIQLYTVTETTGSVGPITCTADCRPKCTITWSGLNLPVGTVALVLQSINRSQAGDYACTASNEVGNYSSTTIKIIVQYGPNIVVLSPPTLYYTVNENNGIEEPITCSADCIPVCTFAWSGPNLLGGTAPVLDLQNIKRNQTGNYLCTASNTINNRTSESVSVMVNYGPLYVSLTPSTPSYSVTEITGRVGPITCAADCIPNCTITWSGPNLPDDKTAIIDVQNITKNQAGVYRCTANNSIASLKSQELTVIVHYAPAVLKIDGNTTYYENDTAEFYCHVDSLPKSSISWSFKDKYTILLELPTDSNTNSLKLTQMNCLSMGKYSCVANNSIGVAAMATNVTVMCAPRLNTIEYEFHPVIVVRDNEPLNITSPLLAYPTPWVYWQLNQNISVINISRKIVNINRVNRHFSTLFIQNLTKDDFGIYTIYAGNGIETNTHIGSYEVRAARRPNKPSNVTCSVGHNYVIVNWHPEFDGGSPQIFRVLYKKHLKKLYLDHPENVSEVDYHPVKIANLQSSSVFLLRVRAENTYNSEVSDEIYCNTTEQVLEDTKTSSIVAVSVGAGLGSATAVISMILTILFVLRRLKTENSKNDKEPMKCSNEEEEHEELKPNPICVSSTDDVVQQSAIYSKVSKVAIQEVCKKNPKKKEKKGKINKPIEMGCVYENHDDIMKGNDQIYANKHDHRNNTKEYNPTKNKDGLIYADLDLAPISAERRFIIRGMDNKNSYAIIDLNKKASPLPSDDEDEETIVEEKET